MSERKMIEMEQVIHGARANISDPRWYRGADARVIMQPMKTAIIYVNPDDVIAIEQTTVTVDWDEGMMEKPCRDVSNNRPWWLHNNWCSKVTIRQKGEVVVTDAPGALRAAIEKAWKE